MSNNTFLVIAIIAPWLAITVACAIFLAKENM